VPGRTISTITPSSTPGLRARGLVGDQAQVGGGIALVDVQAALGEPVAQAGREGFAADQALAQAAMSRPSRRLLQQDAQEAGRAE
jgi:hypothetical protein